MLSAEFKPMIPSTKRQQKQAVDMSNNYSLLLIMLNTTEVVMDFLSERDNKVVNVTYVYMYQLQLSTSSMTITRLMPHVKSITRFK